MLSSSQFQVLIMTMGDAFMNSLVLQKAVKRKSVATWTRTPTQQVIYEST